jgi:peptidoglycan/LPS O-acetylase OafA/YrhL
MEDRGSFQISSPADPQLPDHILQIDLLKALAIVSVIIMHTFPVEMLLAVGAPYTLWHAVPLFILIAGYTGAYGFRRRNAASIRECYDTGLIFRRYSRLLTPYLLYWILEIILLFFVIRVPLDAWSLLVNLVSGGAGWGSYFIPIILESVLVVPLLYFTALRDPDLMVGIAFCLDIVFEAFVVLSGSTALSSFIYFRYLFAGALGVWLVLSTRRRSAAIVVGGIASLVYLTLVGYTALVPPGSVFYQYDGALQFPAFMWTLVLAMTGLAYLPKARTTRISRWLAAIGKASWHIFMVQMLYFLFLADYVYRILNPVISVLYKPLLFGFLPFLIPALGIVGGTINILVCVLSGYGWYASERKLSERASRIIHPS